jgi:hypothetical protein
VINKWTRIGHRWNISRSWANYSDFDQDSFDRWLYRSAENMPTCSKPFCCGNPRRLGYDTWQEKRSAESMKEQIMEYNERKSDPHYDAVTELGWF